MKLPKPKARDRQRLIFDTVQLNGGSRRFWTGDFVEQATASVSSGTRLRTQGDCDICPDVHWRDAADDLVCVV